MQSQKFTIGIDIGGTNTVVGLVNGNGECIERTKFLTQECPSIEDFKMKLVGGISELSQKLAAVPSDCRNRHRGTGGAASRRHHSKSCKPSMGNN